MDRALRETIQVTITNPVTGDTEVIRLTETGPDTGVFVGYLPTTHAASAPSAAPCRSVRESSDGTLR